MPLKTFTIPEAGKTANVQLTGLSVYVVKSPAYADALDAPRLSFNNAGGGFPMLLGSLIGSDQGKYDQLVVKGTAKSAGDEITLLTIDTCQQTNLNLPSTGTGLATAGTSFAKASTDNVQQLDDLEIQKDGRLPGAMYIQARDAQIAFAFDADPDQAGFGYILAPPNNANGRNGSFYKIEGLDFIQKFRFISAAAATPGELIITCEY